jgi:hypothetical protein
VIGPVSFDQTIQAFYFIPVAEIAGTVKDRVFGPLGAVEGAAISLNRTTDNALFNAWPWTAYGALWSSQSDGKFPVNTRVWANFNYLMKVKKNGYQDWTTIVLNPSRGATVNVGDVILTPLDINENQIPDPWELNWFGALVEGGADFDMDFNSNYDEYVAGTIPHDAASVLRIPTVQRMPSGVEICWTVEPGREYRVFGSEAIESGNWTLAAGPWTAGAGVSIMSWTDTQPSENLPEAYRIDVRLP